MSRPCCLKLAMSASSDRFGVGMNLLASSMLAVNESLLPRETSHVGPPLFIGSKTITKKHFNYGVLIYLF